MDLPEDIYYKKTLNFRAWKQELLFRVSQDLFSSFDVDKGTRLLLRSIIDAGYEYTSVLDLGCGYGPLGLTLKKLRPETSLTMVDRDALAVDYARQNAALNGIEDAQIFGSLGYDDLSSTKYSLIIANIPGKAGSGVITSLVQDARYFLHPYGTVAVVVVNPISGLVREALQGGEVEIANETVRSEHTVFHYHFGGAVHERPALTSFDRAIYDREDITIQYPDSSYRMKTVYGLPEFDSLHYATELLMDTLAGTGIRKGSSVAVLNPGQGHAVIFSWRLLAPEHMVLIDRDLLALRTTRRNLFLNGCPEERIEINHRAGFGTENKLDIITGVIREDEGQQVYLRILENILAGLRTGGFYIAAGTSTAITRLAAHVEENNLKAVVKERRKSKGYSSLILQKM